jgi:glycyl-tRNA synthetase (class II)
VDGESISANTVTVRERDSLRQERVAVDQLRDYIGQRIA